MKLYLYRFFVALFAISSFTLMSCSDDDEPNNGGGNENNDQYILYVDDEATYPSIMGAFIDGDFVGTAHTWPAVGSMVETTMEISGDCYRLSDDPLDFSSEYNNLGDKIIADFTIYIDRFDPTTATQGQVISLRENYAYGSNISVRKYEKTTNPTYVPHTIFNGLKSGEITFESLSTDSDGTQIVTYRFNNVIVDYNRDVNGVTNPQSEIKLNGIVVTEYDTQGFYD